MECDYRDGRTQAEAFDEAFATAEAAEATEEEGMHGRPASTGKEDDNDARRHHSFGGHDWRTVYR